MKKSIQEYTEYLKYLRIQMEQHSVLPGWTHDSPSQVLIREFFLDPKGCYINVQQHMEVFSKEADLFLQVYELKQNNSENDATDRRNASLTSCIVSNLIMILKDL
jgi:hypothetical protein